MIIFCDFSILITLLTLPVFCKKIQLVPYREHGIQAVPYREHGIQAVFYREHGIQAVPYREHGIQAVRTGFYLKQQKCIYIVDSDINLHIDIFQPKGIRVLGQRRNYTQYKLFCTLTTLKRKAHYCISIVKLVTKIRYNVTLYLHFLSHSVLSCPVLFLDSHSLLFPFSIVYCILLL